MMVNSRECKAAARTKLIGNYKRLVWLNIAIVFGLTLLWAASMIVFYIHSWMGIKNQLALLTTVKMQGVLVGIMSLVIGLSLRMLLPGIHLVYLNLVQGKPFRLSDLGFAFTHAPKKFLTVGLLFAGISAVFSIPIYFLIMTILLKGLLLELLLAYVLVVMVMIGVCLFLNLNYGWADWILIEDPTKSVGEAFRESQRLMKGSRKAYFYLDISFTGWLILNQLTMGIAYLWLYSYILCTFTCFYLKRKEETAQISQIQ